MWLILFWVHPVWEIVVLYQNNYKLIDSFSTGGPGKGMHSRTTKNRINFFLKINFFFKYSVLNGISFVQSAGCVNHHFSDSGLFGLKISGDYDNVWESHKLKIKFLNDLEKRVGFSSDRWIEKIMSPHW